MGKSDYCVFIGRFQPLHNGHLEIIKKALDEEAGRLIIVIGSHRSPRTLKNPWTYEERKQMIDASLPSTYKDRVIYTHARDYLYSDITWLTGIQNTISELVERKSVKLIGHFKDDSSFYLKLFPQWHLVTQPNYFGISSTQVRNQLFETGEVKVPLVPDGVAKFLLKYSKTDECKEMMKEHRFLKDYKEKWKAAPFPPVFVTTDAVVVQAGHILMVKRKMNPGKGMFALPGGFLQQNKKILDSCLSELKEETNIMFPKEELKKCLKETHVFDHPYRDRRGRTITHAHYFHIDKLGPLPQVRGGDDAAEAMWVPLCEMALHEENIYSDHIHIINYFMNGVGR